MNLERIKSGAVFARIGKLARLSVIVLACAAPCSGAAPAQTGAKEAMLDGIARNVIVPEHQDLAAKCRALTAAAQELARTPTAESLGKTRQAWLSAHLAARQLQWLQTGPMADLEYLSTFYYSKVLTNRIEDVLAATGTLDGAYVAQLGPGTRNMFTLEYLLFPRSPGPAAPASAPGAPEPNRLFGTNAARRCQYVLAIANDVQKKAEQVSERWASTNRQDAAPKFTAGGQATLNSLVNQLAKIIEVVAESHLNFALHLQAPLAPQLDRIEGTRSGSSVPQWLSIVRGTHQAFRGGDGAGIDDYLRTLNPTLATRIEEQFQKCFTALEAIEPPLETALTERKASVQRAYDAVHALELLFKVDSASALGVTITFSSADGD